MAFLNPTAEPFTFPLVHTVTPPTQASGPTMIPLENVLAACLPRNKLVFSGTNCKAYKPIDNHDPDGVSYFVFHCDEASEDYTRRSMRKEVELLNALKTPTGDTHPCIRPYVAFLDDPSYPPAMIVKDIGKPLLKFQENYDGGRLPEGIAKMLMVQLLQGLEWIHSKGIVYRDLHPRRLIIDTAEGEKVSLKISDFRRAIRVDEIHDRYTGGIVFFRPPDVHLGSVAYGTEYDIWSAGCIYAQMISGQQLFAWGHGGVIKQMIRVLDFRCPPEELHRRYQLTRLPWDPEVASWDWYVPIGLVKVLGPVWTPTSFLNSFLQFDPDARTTATEALKSPYLRAGPIPIARPPTPDPEAEKESEEIEEILREIQDLIISIPEVLSDDETAVTAEKEVVEMVEDDTLESILGISV